MPELIRRLIHETAHDQVESLDFPGGSGVTSGGFDGHVRSGRATPFVPGGTSVWEVSVRKNGADKAERDIEKRDAVPDGSPTGQATYVQVIARPWTGAAEWARVWTNKSPWKRVEGYNVDRLTAWVEQAPATRVWFLERIDKPTIGVTSGSEWWTRWSTATEPELPADVVLARGGGDVRPALDQLGITTVGGLLGVNEIVACIVAAASKRGADTLDRVVVVDDRSAWRRLLKEAVPLILIAADADFADDVGPDDQHVVLVPVPQSRDADVVLEPADSELLAQVLRDLKSEPSYELGALARRSFVAFRRRIARRPELMTPPWAVGAIPRSVRAALLLVEWSDGNEADRTVVSTLVGAPYDDLREELLRYTSGDDPLLALTTDRWLLVSPADAWLQLGHRLITDDLQRFVGQATHVLSERDPALDLAREERWRAGLEEKVFAHSGVLRKGVAKGLALLGTFGDRVVDATSIVGEHWVGRAIRPVFEDCNADASGDRWASLGELLPLLAEASPQQVTDAIRVGTTGGKPVLSTIFQDGPGTDSLFGNRSPHSDFLWALETLAWSPEHFAVAVELIAALDALDPGGRLSNRPLVSLGNIFCSWHPDTSADVDQRLAAIDRLRKRQPALADRLMTKLLPEGQRGIHMATSEPLYRSWKPAKYAVLVADHWRVVEGVLDRLLEDVGDDGARWSRLLQAHQHLPVPLRAKVIEAATTQCDPDRLSDESRRQLWEDLRATVAHHREYPDATWAFPESELVDLVGLAARLEPSIPQERHRWLFASQWIDLGDFARADDFDAHAREVARRRTAAIEEILAESGIEGVAAFAATADASAVGAALAEASPDGTTTDQMLAWYESNDDVARLTAANYLWRKGLLGGLDWARQVLADHPDLLPATQAEVLHDARALPAEWDEVRARGEEVERAYWLRFDFTGRGSHFPDVLTAATRMMAVGRSAATLDMLSMFQREAGGDGSFAAAVADGLEGLLVSSADPELARLSEWDFQRLSGILDTHVEALGRRRVTLLQWRLLPALGHEPPTTTLHRALADDPAFFVEILSLFCRSESADPEAKPDVDREVSGNAFRLFRTRRTPPGLTADGEFDPQRAQQWVDEARALLVAADRLTVGLEQIGEVLVFTPSDDDGWPRLDVADLIETLDEDEIDHGIGIGLSNLRGGTSRSLTEGGLQERELAANFRRRAARFRDSHPRVARILNDMAESYEAHSRREDREAEQRRRGLDG